MANGSHEDYCKYKPLTKGHAFYQKAIETNIATVCIGPFGCSKTWTPCALAAQMLAEERIKRVIITRPLVTCGPSLGWLPGDLYERTIVYMRPMLDVMAEFLTKKVLEEYTRKNIVEIVPLEVIEGLTFHDTVVIADEMHHALYIQILMLLTRAGRNCRIILIGNTNSLPGSPLETFIEKLSGMENFQIVCLTEEDIVRSDFVRQIVKRCGDV